LFSLSARDVRRQGHCSLLQHANLLLAIARKAGHVPLGTFDSALAKLEGAHRITG
jgi:hypothetical protein